MTESRLFQYAVIFNPTEEEAKNGQKAKVLVEPATILAKDDQQAYILAARKVPEDYVDKLDQVSIAVRPF